MDETCRFVEGRRGVDRGVSVELPQSFVGGSCSEARQTVRRQRRTFGDGTLLEGGTDQIKELVSVNPGIGLGRVRLRGVVVLSDLRYHRLSTGPLHPRPILDYLQLERRT